MRSAFLTALAASVLLAAAPAAPAASLEELIVGLQGTPIPRRPPPPLSLARLAGGQPFALADLRGRPALVYFWASW